MHFTLPKSNPKELEMIGQLAPGMITCVIAKQTVGRSPFADEGLDSTKKALGAGDGFNVNHMGPSTKEELSLGVSSIQRRCVSVDLIHEKIIVEPEDVECRVGHMPTLEEVTIGRRQHETHLGGI